MKVTAIARRSGGWWAVEVPEVDGTHTQARRLDQIPAMVADAVSLLEDVDPSTVEVKVVPAVEEVDTLLTEIRQAKDIVDNANSSVSAATRAVAADLVHRQQFTVRDAGALMGVSPQRISQLLKDTESVRAAAAAAHTATEGIRQASESVQASLPTAAIAAAQRAAVTPEVVSAALKLTEGVRQASQQAQAALPTAHLAAAATAAAQQAHIESILLAVSRPARPTASDDTVTIARSDYEALMEALDDAQDRLAVLEQRLVPQPAATIDDPTP